MNITLYKLYFIVKHNQVIEYNLNISTKSNICMVFR